MYQSYDGRSRVIKDPMIVPVLKAVDKIIDELQKNPSQQLEYGKWLVIREKLVVGNLAIEPPRKFADGTTLVCIADRESGVLKTDIKIEPVTMAEIIKYFIPGYRKFKTALDLSAIITYEPEVCYVEDEEQFYLILGNSQQIPGGPADNEGPLKEIYFSDVKFVGATIEGNPFPLSTHVVYNDPSLISGSEQLPVVDKPLAGGLLVGSGKVVTSPTLLAESGYVPTQEDKDKYGPQPTEWELELENVGPDVEFTINYIYLGHPSIGSKYQATGGRDHNDPTVIKMKPEVWFPYSTIKNLEDKTIYVEIGIQGQDGSTRSEIIQMEAFKYDVKLNKDRFKVFTPSDLKVQNGQVVATFDQISDTALGGWVREPVTSTTDTFSDSTGMDANFNRVNWSAQRTLAWDYQGLGPFETTVHFEYGRELVLKGVITSNTLGSPVMDVISESMNNEGMATARLSVNYPMGLLPTKPLTIAELKSPSGDFEKLIDGRSFAGTVISNTEFEISWYPSIVENKPNRNSVYPVVHFDGSTERTSGYYFRIFPFADYGLVWEFTKEEQMENGEFLITGKTKYPNGMEYAGEVLWRDPADVPVGAGGVPVTFSRDGSNLTFTVKYDNTVENTQNYLFKMSGSGRYFNVSHRQSFYPGAHFKIVDENTRLLLTDNDEYDILQWTYMVSSLDPITKIEATLPLEERIGVVGGDTPIESQTFDPVEREGVVKFKVAKASHLSQLYFIRGKLKGNDELGYLDYSVSAQVDAITSARLEIVQFVNVARNSISGRFKVVSEAGTPIEIVKLEDASYTGVMGSSVFSEMTDVITANWGIGQGADPITGQPIGITVSAVIRSGSTEVLNTFKMDLPYRIMSGTENAFEQNADAAGYIITGKWPDEVSWVGEAPNGTGTLNPFKWNFRWSSPVSEETPAESFALGTVIDKVRFINPINVSGTVYPAWPLPAGQQPSIELKGITVDRDGIATITQVVSFGLNKFPRGCELVSPLTNTEGTFGNRIPTNVGYSPNSGQLKFSIQLDYDPLIEQRYVFEGDVKFDKWYFGSQPASFSVTDMLGSEYVPLKLTEQSFDVKYGKADVSFSVRYQNGDIPQELSFVLPFIEASFAMPANTLTPKTSSYDKVTGLAKFGFDVVMPSLADHLYVFKGQVETKIPDGYRENFSFMKTVRGVNGWSWKRGRLVIKEGKMTAAFIAVNQDPLLKAEVATIGDFDKVEGKNGVSLTPESVAWDKATQTLSVVFPATASPNRVQRYFFQGISTLDGYNVPVEVEWSAERYHLESRPNVLQGQYVLFASRVVGSETGVQREGVGAEFIKLTNINDTDPDITTGFDGDNAFVKAKIIFPPPSKAYSIEYLAYATKAEVTQYVKQTGGIGSTWPLPAGTAKATMKSFNIVGDMATVKFDLKDGAGQAIISPGLNVTLTTGTGVAAGAVPVCTWDYANAEYTLQVKVVVDPSKDMTYRFVSSIPSPWYTPSMSNIPFDVTKTVPKPKTWTVQELGHVISEDRTEIKVNYKLIPDPLTFPLAATLVTPFDAAWPTDNNSWPKAQEYDPNTGIGSFTFTVILPETSVNAYFQATWNATDFPVLRHRFDIATGNDPRFRMTEPKQQINNNNTMRCMWKVANLLGQFPATATAGTLTRFIGATTATVSAQGYDPATGAFWYEIPIQAPGVAPSGYQFDAPITVNGTTVIPSEVRVSGIRYSITRTNSDFAANNHWRQIFTVRNAADNEYVKVGKFVTLDAPQILPGTTPWVGQDTAKTVWYYEMDCTPPSLEGVTVYSSKGYFEFTTPQGLLIQLPFDTSVKQFLQSPGRIDTTLAGMIYDYDTSEVVVKLLMTRAGSPLGNPITNAILKTPLDGATGSTSDTRTPSSWKYLADGKHLEFRMPSPVPAAAGRYYSFRGILDFPDYGDNITKPGVQSQFSVTATVMPKVDNPVTFVSATRDMPSGKFTAIYEHKAGVTGTYTGKDSITGKTVQLAAGPQFILHEISTDDTVSAVTLTLTSLINGYTTEINKTFNFDKFTVTAGPTNINLVDGNITTKLIPYNETKARQVPNEVILWNIPNWNVNFDNAENSWIGITSLAHALERGVYTLPGSCVIETEYSHKVAMSISFNIDRHGYNIREISRDAGGASATFEITHVDGVADPVELVGLYLRDQLQNQLGGTVVAKSPTEPNQFIVTPAPAGTSGVIFKISGKLIPVSLNW